MDPQNRPYRSVLYIPGSKTRALEKAQTLPTDGIIFDLEDAVAPEAKAEARGHVANALRDLDYGNRALLVRINGFETEWAMDDLAAILPAGPEAILLPKVYSAADIEKLASILDGAENCAHTKIWAMMETPLSMLNAREIAAAPRMAGMVLGSNDLIKDLGAQTDPARTALEASIGLCLLAARAYGLICIDGVYNAFRDVEGLQVELNHGRMMGFDGKSLLHPDQLAPTNTAYRPSEAEIVLAKRQMAAFKEAEESGKGIAVLDGKIVENLHIVTARALLAKADAIAASET
ncbi:MAG: CoA ester lyase [Rhodobacteraceae bacterium]|nr:CoA ester lyase [Paracoccaceae bacterium]